MIAWINITVLLFSSMLLLYFYVRSVSPAGREKTGEPQAYARAGRDRIIAMLFEIIAAVSYVVYFFYPLNTPLPERFPWPWWVSALIAAATGIPAAWVMAAGLRDAGEEAVRPKKEHTLYGGIYARIRHPQAAGEVFLWWVMAFLLHSPFLVVFSFIYIPIFALMCWAEEQDLLLRYGENYAAYCEQTGAFWPRLLRS